MESRKIHAEKKNCIWDRIILNLGQNKRDFIGHYVGSTDTALPGTNTWPQCFSREGHPVGKRFIQPCQKMTQAEKNIPLILHSHCSALLSMTACGNHISVEANT